MMQFIRGPPSEEIVAQFWRLYKEHVTYPTAARLVADKATNLASGILGAISWARHFLHPIPTTKSMLANVLKGYILAMEESCGWKLEVDKR